MTDEATGGDVGGNDIGASAAGRYATALFQLAQEQDSLEPVSADLNWFQTLLEQSPELREMVASPVVSAQDQSRAMGVLLDRVGIKGITGNFLKLVTQNRRLAAVPEIIKMFDKLLARHRGEVEAQIASAHPLTPTQMQALQDNLNAAVGKSVKITATLDPSLLGGLTVKIGSRMIDSSLRTKLNNLKATMKEVN